jgi:hypothetical protein
VGDAADDDFDRGLAEQEEWYMQISGLLQLSDQELKDTCKHSRLPIVLSIRRVTYPLTPKQRFALACIATRYEYA